MALENGVVPVNFGKGIDTKSDPKSVALGKLIRLENGVFTSVNRITKRNGYTSLGATIASVGTMSDPLMVHSYNDELIAADQNLLLSYSPNQNAWYSKGSYVSAELSRSVLSENLGATGICDVAILNNYAVYCWADSLGAIWGSVVDLSTGITLVTTQVYTQVSFALMRVRCVLLGGTTLCVTYQKEAAGTYGARTVSFGGSGVVSFSAETVIATTATGIFDIVPTSTGGAFVYAQSTTPGITVATLSTALAVATTTIAATDPYNVHISTTSNGNIWVYWNVTTDDGSGNLTASTIRYAVLSSALASVLAATDVVALADPYYVSNMISKSDSTTQQTLYFGQYFDNNNGTDHTVEYTNYITVTSTGTVGSNTLFAYGVIPISHPFTIGSSIYAVFQYRSSDIVVSINGTLTESTQPTYFVLELTNLQEPPLVVARFASGVASSYSGLYVEVPYTINAPLFGTNQVYFTFGITVQQIPNTGSFLLGEIAAYSYSLDFSSENNYIATNVADSCILNGAVTQFYDGNEVSEFGFHLPPVITNLTGSAAAGSIADGTYNYIAIFQWIDNNGNLHQSPPSEVATITLASGMPNQVTATVTTNHLSRKLGASVALYRSTGAGGATSSTFYLVSGISYNNATALTAPFVGIVDTSADASIVDNLQPYTYPASSVLENTTPPPSMIMLSRNNRLWFVDSENQNTIWYTKSSQDGVGISPSGFMTEQIDKKFGNITALAEMDEKLVVGKPKGFFIQAGDGVNDVGSGSSLSSPQPVPSDVGITTLKSVITSPDGVMFKSDNGIYILNRKLSVVYIGAEVESYNSQTITSANLVPGKSQIRFLCSSGYTLVYDYIFSQWSTFTNHTGSSATNWNGAYVYANSGGTIFQESTTSYLDNTTAFSLLIQTSWMAIGSIQGFQRVRRLIMLGDYANGNSSSHRIAVSAAYDFSTSFSTPISYSFGASSSSGVFQYRERLPIQKCDSISLIIEETTTGSSLEYLDLTNISFEVGVKKGVNKLRGQQSVG